MNYTALLPRNKVYQHQICTSHHMGFWWRFWLWARRHHKMILILSYIQDTGLMRKSVSFSSAALCLRQWQQNVCVLLNDKAHLLFLMLATSINGRLNEWLMVFLESSRGCQLISAHHSMHIRACWRMPDVIAVSIVYLTFLNFPTITKLVSIRRETVNTYEGKGNP